MAMGDRSVLELPGFFFGPPDEVLAHRFLRERTVHGVSSAPDFLIKEFDVYSTEPRKLPCDSFKYQDEDGSMLFFTPRHSASADKRKNASRTAGTGAWEGKAKKQPIKIGSDVIGHKRSFNFLTKEGTEKIKTEWMMHEYCLSSSPSSTAAFDDLVLCRIHEKGKKRKIDDDGRHSSCTGQAEAAAAAEQSSHAEKDDSSSSLASGHMVPALQSASDDRLFSAMNKKHKIDEGHRRSRGREEQEANQSLVAERTYYVGVI